RIHHDDLYLRLVAYAEVGDVLRASDPRSRSYEATPTPVANDEPLAREDAERFPDRVSAHPELGEQLHLGRDRSVALPLLRLDPRAEHALDLQVARHQGVVCNSGPCSHLYRTQYISLATGVKRAS